jgi:hypothetical protein
MNMFSASSCWRTAVFKILTQHSQLDVNVDGIAHPIISGTLVDASMVSIDPFQYQGRAFGQMVMVVRGTRIGVLANEVKG